ncbi:hypothetical protein M409DRAFT_61718 [Zasmidium cellare ATCC 36951]|uniref:Uncharacterized protein n=1 Tax=Zasmidium cellare ATCC 36951 TaxID=1080233 RepID=A0A6A6BY87_ZASCE|nr:uncharacterized protein M409DRAFT_61718 [Zasmidium cellare ATCC 36951]KAF2158366.1 hypothetical protein M409DRAFT_61718 [Zasmidium cellare ATCC 36951]
MSTLDRPHKPPEACMIAPKETQNVVVIRNDIELDDIMKKLGSFSRALQSARERLAERHAREVTRLQEQLSNLEQELTATKSDALLLRQVLDEANITNETIRKETDRITSESAKKITDLEVMSENRRRSLESKLKSLAEAKDRELTKLRGELRAMHNYASGRCEHNYDCHSSPNRRGRDVSEITLYSKPAKRPSSVCHEYSGGDRNTKRRRSDSSPSKGDSRKAVYKAAATTHTASVRCHGPGTSPTADIGPVRTASNRNITPLSFTVSWLMAATSPTASQMAAAMGSLSLSIVPSTTGLRVDCNESSAGSPSNTRSTRSVASMDSPHRPRRAGWCWRSVAHRNAATPAATHAPIRRRRLVPGLMPETAHGPPALLNTVNVLWHTYDTRTV